MIDNRSHSNDETNQCALIRRVSMGCNTSAVNVVHPLVHSTPDLKSPVLPAVSRSPIETWNAIEESLPVVKSPKVARDKHGKTIHIYVASTFTDFHAVRKTV